ncbi:hypothetical protein FGO68_gene8976 [Halteria grandinella]|uniref:Uncharacterized protein n=1 Tax=Halteria grandinella TaxID=5974 RepID=A0A8J8NKD5_HALGN|nr:hypothetical protein FGO68_gene8976 [Halteria grandinella]
MKFQVTNHMSQYGVSCKGIQSLGTFAQDLDRINAFILANISDFDLHSAHLLRFKLLDYKLKFEKAEAEQRVRQIQMDKERELRELELRYRYIFMSRYNMGRPIQIV